MVTRDTAWPAGTPCWIDLAVDDISRASAFYTGMFGWYVQEGPPEAGGYAMCLKDDRPVAGIGPARPPGTPAAWTTYLASDDLDETVSKVKAAGGLTLMEPMNVMDVGRMAVAADLGGAVFGASGRPRRDRGGPGQRARLAVLERAESATPTTRTRLSTRPCSATNMAT